MMKRCPQDDLKFPADRRFCATCGAVLVDEFEAATLLMPKMKSSGKQFIAMNDDLTFRLSIRDRNYTLSMDEIRILAAEACATVKTADQQIARPEN